MYSVCEYWCEDKKQRIECINRLSTWEEAINIARQKLNNLGLRVEDLDNIKEDLGFYVVWKGHMISIVEI